MLVKLKTPGADYHQITAESMGLPIITDESSLEARIKAARKDFNRQYRHLRQADGHYYAKRGGGGRGFHLFPKLPAELQLLVWREAVKNLTVPNIQEFDFDFAYDPDAAPEGRVGNGLTACFKPKRTRQLAGHRSLLMACIDSRKAFLDSGKYHMLPLTYLVGFEDKEITKKEKKRARRFETTRQVGNTTFKVKKTTPKVKTVAHKVTNTHSQANMAFVRVLLPVSFEHTCFLIDKIEKPFAYESVHPTPPPAFYAYSQAAGLEFVRSIKKLAFAIHKNIDYKSTLISHFFETSYKQCRLDPNAPPYDLGALEQLSYVSAKAVERQCCIGWDQIWNSVPSITLQQFERQFSTSQGWERRDLIGLHVTLWMKWAKFHWDFNLRWGGAVRQKCTCHR